MQESFYNNGGGTLERTGYPERRHISEKSQDQVGQDPEQPGIIKYFPAHCRGVGQDDLSNPNNPMIL